MKILTILDHTRTRLNLVKKAILLNLCLIVLDHLGPFETIEDYLRPYKNQVESGYKGHPIEFMVDFF